MDTKLLFKNSVKLNQTLLSTLEKIHREKSDIIEICEISLMEMDESIRKLKSMVSQHHFENLADEIEFFKNVKPKLISKFIYYSKILAIESTKPPISKNFIKKHYSLELKKIKRFYRENKDFYTYYKKKATYLDQIFFVRNKQDIKLGLSSNLYDLDENFTTSHDALLSEILVYESLEKYLQQKLCENQVIQNLEGRKTNIIWTNSKSALVELLYALHQSKCFNGGNIEFSELVRDVEKNLNINLGNYYKTIGEIKNRKNGRTKFLQLLNDNLNQLFLDTDE